MFPVLATKTILPTQVIHQEETLILRLGGAPKIVLVSKGFGEREKANPILSYQFISFTCIICTLQYRSTAMNQPFVKRNIQFIFFKTGSERS